MAKQVYRSIVYGKAICGDSTCFLTPISRLRLATSLATVVVRPSSAIHDSSWIGTAIAVLVSTAERLLVGQSEYRFPNIETQSHIPRYLV